MTFRKTLLAFLMLLTFSISAVPANAQYRHHRRYHHWHHRHCWWRHGHRVCR